MKSMSPPWVWIALALLVIGYVVTPPAVIQQATA
jgi:Sec-independent protein secretion pathway component TatC